MSDVKRRPDTYGLGVIEPHRGKFRYRPYIEGQRKTLASGTYEECESVRRGFAVLRARGEAPTATKPTLRSYGARWLDRRELAGSRDIANERSRWKKHVEAAPFFDWALGDIQRSDARAWLDSLIRKRPGGRHTGMRLSSATVRHAWKMLRACLASAVTEELIEKNPTDGLRVPRRDDEQHAWTWLTPDEQARLLVAIPEQERWLVQVALGTGLRQSELYRLPLSDAHVEDAAPHFIVRFSRGGRATKNAKVRRVPLFGLALEAMRAWLARLPVVAKENPFKLVFPTARGCRRGESKPPRGWKQWLHEAGLDRPERRHDGRAVRWHDLRHTCASSLIAGWWGRPWALHEVRDLLGHSSIRVTERYAHLAPSVLAEAARLTTGTLPTAILRSLRSPQVAPTREAGRAQMALIPGYARPDSNGRPSDSKSAGEPAGALGIDPAGGDLGAAAARLYALGERQLRAVAGRSRFAARYSVELAELALDVASALRAMPGKRGVA